MGKAKRPWQQTRHATLGAVWPSAGNTRLSSERGDSMVFSRAARCVSPFAAITCAQARRSTTGVVNRLSVSAQGLSPPGHDGRIGASRSRFCRCSWRTPRRGLSHRYRPRQLSGGFCAKRICFYLSPGRFHRNTAALGHSADYALSNQALGSTASLAPPPRFPPTQLNQILFSTCLEPSSQFVRFYAFVMILRSESRIFYC